MKTGWVALVLSLLLVGLSPGLDRVAGASDYSGTYFTTVGPHPRFTLQITQTGSSATFTLSGRGLAFQGTGSVSATTMTLAGEVGEGVVLSMVLTFSPGGDSFSGSWEATTDNPAAGTITGTKVPWTTYDVDAYGIPRLVGADCIELRKIDKISRLRSGEGHDYSDDFESCRSMKHYYYPRTGVERSSVVLFSPVTGTVIGATDEWEDPTLWKGRTIGIQVAGYPAFDVVVFHIDLATPLEVGDSVVAGQVLGTSEKASGTVTDVALGVHTPLGYRLLSIFAAMPDRIFAAYRARGIDSREDLVITREERDAQPLTCQGEEFLDPGALENWVTLSAPAPPTPARRGVRRRLHSHRPR
jgi:hypothetical protein